MHKILAVDDSVVIRSQIEDTLNDAGFTIFLADDGRAGLESFSNIENLAAVITDVNMPEMNGIELVKEIRKKNKTIPILILTTETETDLQKQGAAAGANGWIIKPIRPKQFMDIVKQVIEP